MIGKVLIASDSFKGSLTSRQVGLAAAGGVEKGCPGTPCEIVEVADGGEGTVNAIVTALNGRFVEVQVSDPLGRPVLATYGICKQRDDALDEGDNPHGAMAVIEVAAAGGLPLLSEEEHNPWLTTSRGTGELIRDALLQGCRHFLIGLGGSATNDAGMGMLQALGYRFLDHDGKEVGNGGGETGRVVRIDCTHVMPELKEASFTVACDVTNPLTGLDGASHVFGPQKGADAAMVERLDCNLASFARVSEDFLKNDSSSHSEDSRIDNDGQAVDSEEKSFSERPGAGAAGGLGFAFSAFLGAQLQAGIDMVLEAVDFPSRLKNASLVITGEGRIDRQTCMGKTPYGVLRYAQKADVPVIAIGGAVMEDAVADLMKAGFAAVFPIVAGPLSLAEALTPEVASRNVERTVSQILRVMSLININ